LTGGIIGQISLGNNVLLSQGDRDFFVAEFDSDGELLWFDQVGGDSRAVSSGFAFDTNLNVVLTGTYTNAISFNGIGLESFEPNHNVYSARLNRGMDLSIGSIAEPLVQSMFNYPNPFNPNTSIRLLLSHPSKAQLDIYNIKGQLVNRLFEGDLPSGVQEIEWDGRDFRGRNLPSGVYFYRLSTHNEVRTEKMLLLK
jgi:hypothetical protein